MRYPVSQNTFSTIGLSQICSSLDRIPFVPQLKGSTAFSQFQIACHSCCIIVLWVVLVFITHGRLPRLQTYQVGYRNLLLHSLSITPFAYSVGHLS